MADRLRFGIFVPPLHTEPGQNPTLALQRDVELVQLADRLGYDEAWIGEHHSCGAEIIASPEIFIGYLAPLTRHIKLGAGVISLPYHNPLWVADRALLLDHLTRGRFMLGIGPGALAIDASMIGIDPGSTRDALAEDFPVLMHLLTNDEPITASTSRYRLVDARCQLTRYSPFDIVVTTVGTPSGPLLAGRHGVGMLQLSGLTARNIANLPSQWSIAEHEAEVAKTTIKRKDWRITGLIHIADTREQAIQDVEFGLADFLDYAQEIQQIPAYQEAGHTRQSRLSWAVDSGAAVVGTVSDVIAKIEAVIDATGGFGCFMSWAHEWADPKATRHSYEMFARYVMPQFQPAAERLGISREWARGNAGPLNEKLASGARRFTEEHSSPVTQP